MGSTSRLWGRGWICILRMTAPAARRGIPAATTVHPPIGMVENDLEHGTRHHRAALILSERPPGVRIPAMMVDVRGVAVRLIAGCLAAAWVVLAVPAASAQQTPAPTPQGAASPGGPATVTVTAQGNNYRLTFPLELVAQPPTGARLYLNVDDVSGVSAPEVALTSPVKPQDQGIPWGTIGLAVAAALFIGAFVGNMFSTRR